MAEIEAIAAAIDLIDGKKKNLKKAFDDLQAHRSLLSPSFPLFSWSEIDSHFSSLQSSLSDRLRLLQSESPLADDLRTLGTSDAGTSEQKEAPVVAVVVVQPELRSLCEKMDGIGLSKYLIDRWDDNALPNQELSAAFRFSSDPASMVLDAIEATNLTPPSSSGKSFDVRRVFVLLMEALIEINANVTVDMRERAKKLACDWKTKIDTKPFEALGFLHLVAAFELGSEFSSDDLSDYIILIAKYKQATSLCNKIGLDKERVGNLIKKLLDSGKSILAVKFMYECGMAEGFEPILILKAYIKESCEAAHRICLEDNYSLKSQNEATDKEVSALKAAIKIIKDHKLESEFSDAKVEERVEELEKQKALRKRNAAANPQPETQPKGRKRPRDRTRQHPEAVLIPELSHPGLQLNPFGLVNPLAGIVLPYVNPLALAGLYGSAATPRHSQQTGFVLPPQHNPAYYSQ